jgi:hypothetical protein
VPLPGELPGFFCQLALGADERLFSRFQSTGGEFEQGFAHRVPVLRDDDQRTVIQTGQNDGRTRVTDGDMPGEFAGREADVFFNHVKYPSGEQSCGGAHRLDWFWHWCRLAFVG